jgi:LPS-assembly protein
VPNACRSAVPSTMTRALCVLWLLLLAVPATRAGAQEIANCKTNKQWTIDRLSKDHVKLVGAVEIDCGQETLYADEAEIFNDQHRVVATGNVVFTSGDSRIAAERLEFDTKTKTGTFYNAAGSAALQPPDQRPERPGQPVIDRSMWGTQEPDVYFYGEKVAKVGEKKYRITRGGFTTCVQPEPRWKLTSGTVTIRLEHYAILTNSLFRVKNVPVLYLPIFYYPVKKDDRATGFLLPSYGSSTVRGQSLSNVFFWAVSRSQDVTFLHDWFSRTGQGYGGEYRYIRGPGADGYFRAYRLQEHEATYTDSTGEEVVQAGRKSYELRGSLNQRFGKKLRARGRVDYFSSLAVQQTYHMNVYDASRTQRSYSGSLTANLAEYTILTSVDRSEYFYGTTSSSVRAGQPRITFSRGERPLFGSPVYFGVNGDFNNMIVERKSGKTIVDQSLSRVDVTPRIRIPFTKWQFLTVNSTAAFRLTYWTESKTEKGGPQVPEGISRKYYELQANVTGPVFNRIWSFKDKAYAEKIKHSVEPYFNVQRVSAVDNFDRIVQIDSADIIVGDSTRYGYGIANRFFRKPPGGRSREIGTVTVGQTYYTDARASLYDQYYRSNNGTAPSKFSPLAITARAVPTDRITANFRAEYDTRYDAFRTMAADGTVQIGQWLQSIAGWSQRRYIPELAGYNDKTKLDHYLNAATNVRFQQNKYGGSYQFNYDVTRKSFLQQRMIGYYNAQCCGFSVEYQAWDLSRLTTITPVTRDHRLNFSISLAGIGTSGNNFGSLGATPGLTNTRY